MSKIYGDWGKISRLNSLSYLKEVVIEESIESAKVLREQISTTIREGKSEGVPLKIETVNKKGHNTKLYEEGDLANSFNVEVLGDSVLVVPKGNHKRGLTNEQLAIIMEKGNSKTPPRPFVEPVWKNNEDKVKEKLKDKVENFISNL